MDEKEHKRFFACIGNPPYQDDTGGGNDSFTPPLYHYMIDAGSLIADRVEMITPARFLFNAGSTPKAWNKKMLENEHFKVMSYNANSSDVFPGVEINGGVAVTYYDETKEFEPIDTFIAIDELRSIFNKVKPYVSKRNSFSQIISGRSVYRLSQAALDENPNIVELQSTGHATDINSSAFTKLTNIVFFQDIPDDGNHYVKILGLLNRERTYMWMRRDYINPPNSFCHYKVFLPNSNGSDAIGESLSTPLIGAPLIGSPLVGATDTFLSIGCFDTEDEAQACMKYIKTKFARAMLGVLKVTPNNPAPKWKYVPLQDFTSSSDIDWSQSVPGIDRQLYAKYGLSDEEITFIEERVKAME